MEPRLVLLKCTKKVILKKEPKFTVKLSFPLQIILVLGVLQKIACEL